MNILVNELNKFIDKYKYIHKNLIKKKVYKDHIVNCYHLKNSLCNIEYKFKKLLLKNNIEKLNDYEISIIHNHLLKIEKLKNNLKNIDNYVDEIIKENQYKNVGLITIINTIYIPFSLIFCFFGMNLDKRFTFIPFTIIILSIIISLIFLFLVKNSNFKNYINKFLNGIKEKSNLEFNQNN